MTCNPLDKLNKQLGGKVIYSLYHETLINNNYNNNNNNNKGTIIIIKGQIYGEK